MDRLFAAFCAVFCLFSCAEPKEPDRPYPPLDVYERYLQVANRLESEHLQKGWVVSRHPDGSPEHQGDSLIWSGTALAALPCDRGHAIEDNLIETVTRLKGALVRIEPLGEYSNGRQISLDGAVGFWSGVARRLDCEGAADKWRDAIEAHYGFLQGSEGRLHPESQATYPPPFAALPGLLARNLNVGGGPTSSDVALLTHTVELWALAVVKSKKACFRLNLGWLTLKALEASGEEVNWGGFCAATDGSGIELIDHRCGRGDLAGWIDSWQPNVWEYEHQRCKGWESPDGDGDYTPGLDFLTGVREAYQF